MATLITPREVRQHWLEGREIALLDVREEGPYSNAHPLFAVNVPVSEIEERLETLVPRVSAPVVVYDNGEGYAERAAVRINALGYSSVAIMEGGLDAYSSVGEVYRDVNVPSKAFGELVEAILHTPSLSAVDMKSTLEANKDVVVLDARRFEEFNTMSIPRGRSCPGGELVYRINDAVTSPETLVIVNCAGRTRSIIGTQSLINSGITNKVLALRNGTIGWTLEGLDLNSQETKRVPEPSQRAQKIARLNAERWASHVGVPIISGKQLAQLQSEAEVRTLYKIDVRDPVEYAAGHSAGFVSAPGGQLVQAIDEWVGVRGARIVLVDNDGVRARMAASWLLQMGWDVFVLEQHAQIPDLVVESLSSGFQVPEHAAMTVFDLQKSTDVTILDLARSSDYSKGHIPGAWFASGPELLRDLKAAPSTGLLILTSPNGQIAAANVEEAQKALPSQRVCFLKGGTKAWSATGCSLETETRWLSEPIDMYKRPYEGTNSPHANMQAYIDWELQLVAQLANDGVSRFHVTRGAM